MSTVYEIKIGGGYLVDALAAPAGVGGGDVSLGLIDAPLPGEVYVDGSATTAALLNVQQPPDVYHIEATANGQAYVSAVEESDPQVWYEFNPTDYANIDAVWADPNIINRHAADNTKTLETGYTMDYGTDQKVIKVVHPGNTNKNVAGVHIMFPDSDTDQPRDIWMEMWFRFSDNWKTDWGGSTADHKFWLSYPEYDGAYRWEIKVGSGTYNSVHSYIVENGACNHLVIQSRWPDRETYFWNDEWVRWRQRMKWHTSGVCESGLHEIWVYSPTTSLDLKLAGTNPSWDTYHEKYWYGQVANDQAINSKYWRQTLLSDVVNEVPTEDVWFYIGRFRAWITDPGW